MTGHSPAWVTLDETDDEPHRFWTYVLTALQRVAPDVAGGALAALRVPSIDPLDVALPTLLNDLSASDARHTLILDDYHLLTDVRIHEAVEYLLSYLPPSLRLVIAARFDPPLPLARMRARGELTEIRAADLRFRAAEAAGLVAAVSQVDVGSGAVDALVERTEGWAVGLKLAALTIRGSADPAAPAAAARDDRHIVDFLSSEVLDRLPADRRAFLVRTAVLDRLSGSALRRRARPLRVGGGAGSPRAGRPLRRPAGCSPRVVPIPPALPGRADPRAERNRTRGRPGAAPPGRGLVPGGRAGRPGGAPADARRGTGSGPRRCCWRRRTSSSSRARPRRTCSLGDQLGEAAVRADPRLAVSMAGAAAQSGRLERVPALLDLAEARLGDHSPPYPAWRSLAAAAAVLRAAYDPRTRADPPAMLAAAERAAGLETDPTLQGYVIARITLGAVLSGLGRPEDAVPVLAEAWERSGPAGVPVFIGLQAAGLLGMCLVETGQQDEARRLVHRVAPAVQGMLDALGDAAAAAVAFLVAVDGRLAYHDGRTEDARRLLSRAAELARIAGHPSQRVYVLTALADAHLAAGDRTAARSALAEARETVDTEIAFPASAARLAAAENRVGRRRGPGRPAGRSAGRGADRPGALPAARVVTVRSASGRSAPSSTCR